MYNIMDWYLATGFTGYDLVLPNASSPSTMPNGYSINNHPTLTLSLISIGSIVRFVKDSFVDYCIYIYLFLYLSTHIYIYVYIYIIHL